MKILLLLISLSPFLNSQEMYEMEMTFENDQRSYLIYEPKNYQDSLPIDLFIGIHGYGGTASGFERETTGNFNKSADKYNFIAIYPQGEIFYEKWLFMKTFVSSWNDLAGSVTKTSTGETCAVDADIAPKYPKCKSGGRCSWTSCSNDIGYIKKVIDNTKEAFNIKNIYVVGMSNGGMMAQALACAYPELFSGIANVVGMQHKDLSCTPEKPVNFIIYGGAKDTVVPPISVKSFDGYFYEPMENTFKSWSNKFNCKSIKQIKNEDFDLMEEKIAYGCDNNVTITSILNNDRGHRWPGVNRDVGYCNTLVQSIKPYATCNNNLINDWGNDYLVEKLLKLSK